MKIFIFMFAGLLCAQDQKLASVKGVVVNSITGEPLSKTTVRLLVRAAQTTFVRLDESKSREVTTSATGEFQFKDLDPGTYSFEATRQGFLNGGAKSRPTSKVVTVGAGESLDSVKLTLAPQAIIAGRVTDSDGEPMQNLVVQALRRNWDPGMPNLMRTASVVTNDLGEYRLNGLVAGRYYVLATHSRMRIGPGPKDAIEETYPPVFSPGITDLSQARPIDVTAGATRSGVDIRMFKTTSHRVRGKVVIEDGSTSHTGLILLPQSGTLVSSPSDRVSARRDGAFEFHDILPGSYFLTSATSTSYCRMPVEVHDKDVEGLVAYLRPGITVATRIHWDGDAPPGSEANRRIHVTIGPQDDLGIGHADEDGVVSIQLKNLLPGPNTVTIVPPIGAYVKALGYGNQEVDGDVIEAVEGGELEIVLRAGTAAFEGTVEIDDATVPDASVAIVPVAHKQRRALYKQVSTDQNGYFKIQNIAPGEYDAYAFESIDYGFWFDPDFVTKYGRRAERIKIEEKSHESKKLTLIKASDR